MAACRSRYRCQRLQQPCTRTVAGFIVSHLSECLSPVLPLSCPWSSLLPPLQVHVQQLPSASDGGGVGWFLDRVEVAGPEGQHWSFPCSAWLGKSNSPAGLDGAWGIAK